MVEDGSRSQQTQAEKKLVRKLGTCPDIFHTRQRLTT